MPVHSHAGGVVPPQFAAAFRPPRLLLGVAALVTALLFSLVLQSWHSRPARRASPASRSVRIALLADPHLSPDGFGKRNIARFEVIAADVRRSSVSLAVVAGDLSNGGRPEQLRESLRLAPALGKPCVVVPGNRDVGNRVGLSDRGEVTEERVRQYEALLGPSYQCIEKDGVRIVLINASLLGSRLPAEQKQWDALDRWLAGPSADPTLVVLHYPLFLTSPDEPDSPRNVVDPASRRRLLALIKRAGVRLVVCGHMHRGRTIDLDGVRYLHCPAVGLRNESESESDAGTAASLPAWIVATFTPGVGWQLEYRQLPDPGQPER